MFSFEFPANAVHFRPPVFDPRPGTLVEPEIYTRLLEQMGALPREFRELAAAAQAGREHYYQALIAYLGTHRSMASFIVPIVYRTLGPTLPGSSPALAFAWSSSHGVARKYPDAVGRAGHTGDTPFALGEAVF